LREGGAGEKIRPLCFSADSATIFSVSGAFEAAVYAVSTGRILSRYRTSSWLTAASFLSSRLVAAAGAEGLVLYGDQKEPALLTRGAAEGTGASADGTLVCSGDRAGVLTCFIGEPAVALGARPESREDEQTPSITASTSSRTLAVEVVGYSVLAGLAI